MIDTDRNRSFRFLFKAIRTYIYIHFRSNRISHISCFNFRFHQSLLKLIMVRRIEGTIDYEKHNEVLNDNHKILIYLDDMTLTGKII